MSTAGQIAVSFALVATIAILVFGARECSEIEARRFEACVKTHPPLECEAATNRGRY